MKLTVILTLIFLPALTFSQTDKDYTLEKELNILTALKNDSLHNELPTGYVSNGNNMEMRGGDDADDDGMDDFWEMQNGLDPDDPEDAFEDLDGDHVINLFEYQMDGDPNNMSSPASINYDTMGGTLQDLLRDNDGSNILIKVAEGTYFEHSIVFYTTDTKIMIQGGWSTDFTDFDPDTYPTIFDGSLEDEVIYISTSASSQAGSLVAILDGLQLINGSGDGTFGNITLIGRVNHDFSIYRCKVSGGIDRGMGILNWGGDGRVTIAQVECYDIVKECVYTQNTNNGNICWRDYNNTFTDNILGGIDGFTLDSQTKLDYKATNCIYREQGISLIRNVDLSIFNCNINTFPTTPDVDSLHTENLIDEDSKFVDATTHNYQLMADSPCVDSGIPVGLMYSGPNPDIGANELLVSSRINKVNEIIKIDVYPNPTVDKVRLSEYLDSYRLYDLNGKIVLKGKETNSINLSHLPTGNYTLTGQKDEKQVIERILKVAAK